ncbi:MAG: antibiotic biosynthesis monooxygenase [Alphaproteobacteria bacterium]|nr:antibiotic biosynthesis monooxygenase [Alphaproteobacteria bacterium]MBV9540520.1 antibiotic biosynthesis monooxygenase [Alphaproteobacteria bacterium]MBV9905348.1 antibiotic biosynthesis monooxygenase [Alphaproteobacteria bacterium]
MGIGIVATIKIQEGKNAEFEAAATEMMGLVKKNEPGNSLYQFCKSRKEPTTYVVMEMYSDQAALEAHGKSDHYKAFGGKIGGLLAGRPDVQFYDTV